MTEAEIDAECERILKMSDAEIVAHIREQGEDPEEVAAHMNAIIRRAIAATKAKRLCNLINEAECDCRPGDLCSGASDAELALNRPARFLAWCRQIFGPVALDNGERAHRFVEEAIELGQSAGITADTLRKMTDRVYGRPAGELRREIGQAMATLELFAENVGLSADDEAEREFVRVQAISKEEWKRRHDAKVALGIASN